MEKTAPRFDPRAVLAVLGLALVVAAVWATTALAAGGSPAATAGTGWGGDPSGSVFVQDSNESGAAPSRDDCPEGDGSGGDSAPADGPSSSGNDL